MGLIDDYKSPKNRELITMASLKMIKDKYKIEINADNITIYQNIIKNAITSVSNDAILINTKVKLQELNNITLVKIKEQIDVLKQQEQQQQQQQQQQRQEKEQEQQQDNSNQQQSNKVDNQDKKISDEEIISKVQELEEKRRISNMLLQTEGYKMVEDAISTDTQQQQYQSNINAMNSYFNPTIITDVIHQISDVKKSSQTSKVIVINSHNRDWIKYPDRNALKFSINIDFGQHYLEPYKLIFPYFVKELTPYVIMCISDGLKMQKFYFTYLKSNGSLWDEWLLMNKKNTEYIILENKTWNIILYDYMNNELHLGNDDIQITEVNKIDENTFKIKITKDDEYTMNLIKDDSYANVLLKTHSDNIECARIKRIKNINDNSYEEYTLKNDDNLELQDFLNSKILNLNAQYSVVMMQQKKV